MADTSFAHFSLHFSLLLSHTLLFIMIGLNKLIRDYQPIILVITISMNPKTSRHEKVLVKKTTSIIISIIIITTTFTSSLSCTNQCDNYRALLPALIVLESCSNLTLRPRTRSR